MLYLDNKVVATLLNLQRVAISAAELVKLPLVQCQVEQFFHNSRSNVAQCKHINVIQSEVAMVDFTKEPNNILLSSVEATSCCVVELACRVSQRYAVGHFHRSHIDNKHCLNILLRGMLRPNLYLAGAYCEDTGVGHSVASAILNAAHQSPIPIHLQLAVVDALNTTPDGHPKVCNFGVHVSDQVENAVMLPEACDKGPELIPRRARQWLQQSKGLVQVYNASQQALVFCGVSVQLSFQQAHYCYWLLSCSDKALLQSTSTSPQHEAASFVPGTILCAQLLSHNALCTAYSVSRDFCTFAADAEMRAMLRWMLQQSSRGHTEACEDKVYYWDGQWHLKSLLLQTSCIHAMQL